MSSTEHYKTYYKGFYTQNISDGMTSEAASIAANASVQDMYKANPFNMANPFTGEGILASGAKAMINTDYLDELFKTATTQQYDLSISGGSDKSKYFISLRHLTHITYKMRHTAAEGICPRLCGVTHLCVSMWVR